MPNFEIITEQKAADLIGKLQKKRTFLKVSVPHRSYERLTLITDIKEVDSAPSFQIDLPEGLNATLDRSDNGRPTLQFEFYADDQLPHRFESPVLQVVEDGVWLSYPEHIQRYQLRENYRIKAPEGAGLAVRVEETNIRMIVVNISLGGIYCHCPKRMKAQLPVDLQVASVKLDLTVEGEGHSVTIDRAQVRRVERSRRAKHFGIALEFIGIRKQARQKLTQIIYDLQRSFLRKRLHREG